MAAELRWVLAGLSLLLLGGIWWWGARRARQSPGNAELRESSVVPPVSPARGMGPADEESNQAEARGYDASPRNWSVSPLEPLSIRTADFEAVRIEDLPMRAHADPLEETLDLGLPDPGDPPEAPAEPEVPPAPPAQPPVANGNPNAGASANASETQRIISIRVCAAGESRWTGRNLMAALENHGLAHGRYNVFHRKHSDGRTLFCAASLVEPGIFNLANMPREEYRGMTLFAVLPGPVEPLQTVDALLQTAGELADTLGGTVQDSDGVPLSAQRAEALREDIGRFERG